MILILQKSSTFNDHGYNQLYNWVANGDGQVILDRETQIFQDDKFASKDLLMQRLNEYPKEGIHNLILQYVLSVTPS